MLQPELKLWLLFIMGACCCGCFIWFRLELMREAVRSLVVPPGLEAGWLVEWLAMGDAIIAGDGWALIRFCASASARIFCFWARDRDAAGVADMLVIGASFLLRSESIRPV